MSSYDVINFQQDVIEKSNSVPVVVDFWAEWCGPCKFLSPIIEKLADEANGKWELVKINTEIHQDLAAEWGIRGIPNLKLFYKGEIIEDMSGALAEPEMRRWLEEKLPSEAKTLLMESKQLISQGEKEEAYVKLEQALKLDPVMTEARLEYAKILLWKEPEKAQKLVEDMQYIDEAAEIGLVSEALSITEDILEEDVSKPNLIEGLKHLKRHQLDDFFKSFIQAIILNKSYHDEFARKMVVALFHLLGESHEITKRYRRRFDMALY